MKTIAFLICAGGCSLALSGPDPKRPATTAPTCDTGKGLVGIDVVTAFATGILGIATLSGRERGVGGGLVLTSAIYGAAALHGNAAASRCREAFEQYETAVTGMAHKRAPARAAEPQDRHDAPAVASRPAPIPKPPPEPPPAELAKPAEPAVQTGELGAADAFHVAVGAPEPGRPARPRPNPARPVANDAWLDFWRGIP